MESPKKSAAVNDYRTAGEFNVALHQPRAVVDREREGILDVVAHFVIVQRAVRNPH